MRIQLNGKITLIENEKNLYDILLKYNINPGIVVIEMDENIINRENWETTEIREDSIIEIITIVGGG